MWLDQTRGPAPRVKAIEEVLLLCVVVGPADAGNFYGKAQNVWLKSTPDLRGGGTYSLLLNTGR